MACLSGDVRQCIAACRHFSGQLPCCLLAWLGNSRCEGLRCQERRNQPSTKPQCGPSQCPGSMELSSQTLLGDPQNLFAQEVVVSDTPADKRCEEASCGRKRYARKCWDCTRSCRLRCSWGYATVTQDMEGVAGGVSRCQARAGAMTPRAAWP